MCDLFFSFLKFAGNLFEQAPHVLFPVQHVPGFLVTLNIVLYFLLQIFVHPFVLEDAQQTLIDFAVEHFVLVGELEVFLSQGLPLDGGLVEFALAVPD
jgi:hypothetical protein